MLLILVLLYLTGCSGIDRNPAKTLTAKEQEQLQALILAGQDALTAGRLDASGTDQPTTRNAQPGALEFFNQALGIQPSNSEARRGQEQVLERYLAQASQTAAGGDFSLAFTLLSRARAIDPEHPSIAPTQTYIDDLANADIRSVVVAGMSSTALNQIVDSLVREMGPQNHRCRFRIFAPSDAETRALYRILRDSYAKNKLTGRIRASTAISQPKRLERICTS